MQKSFWQAVILFLLILMQNTNADAQFFSPEKENPYQKVFVETDNFGISYLDILEEEYVKVTIDSLQFSMLNDLAYYWHTRDLLKAADFTRKGLQLTEKKQDLLWYGRFQITHGAILLRMEKLDSAYVVLESAKRKVKEKDLPFLHTQLGYVFERKGDLIKAADYALESLRLGEKLGDKKAIALAYSDLSNLFWKQSKFKKGLEYGLKSLEFFEERGINDLDYDFTLYVVGNNHLALKEHEEALKYYEYSISIGERYGFYNNLSDVYIALIDLYSYLGKFHLAESAGQNALKYAKLLHNDFLLMRSWLSVGKMQYLQGKYISAIESLQKSITIATNDFGDEYYLSQAYETLGKSYAGNHNYQEAYLAFEEYDLLKNKIFTAEADARTTQIQAELDLEKKDNTIESQVFQIKKQKSKQTLVSVLAGALFLLLLLLFITFQNNRKKNRLLEKQNMEKEFLLKEIHHRVKNNLGVVSSLLSLQANQIKDPNIFDALQESQNRVFSMSMIHQKLYLGKDLTTVEMKDYFMNLGAHILDSFGMENRVTIMYNMKPVEVIVDTAIPLGLIVNELITNSLKYAFPESRKGIIAISLKYLNNNNLSLMVSDNGIGKHDKPIEGTGFGTVLIDLLTKQLEGIVKKETKEGTTFHFEFKVDKVIPS
jgi:two-component sensor histidine kinase